MKEDERTQELLRMLTELNDMNRQRALSILRSLLFAQRRQAGGAEEMKFPKREKPLERDHESGKA